MKRFLAIIAAFLSVGIVLISSTPAAAGMPSFLPEDLETIDRLSSQSVGRFQAISFFLFAILIITFVVRWLWNVIARDMHWLPSITLGKALAVVMLWGFLFVIVLTMISGARELMTPGAWKKDGFTYELSEESNAISEEGLTDD